MGSCGDNHMGIVIWIQSCINSLKVFMDVDIPSHMVMSSSFWPIPITFGHLSAESEGPRFRWASPWRCSTVGLHRWRRVTLIDPDVLACFLGTWGHIALGPWDVQPTCFEQFSTTVWTVLGRPRPQLHQLCFEFCHSCAKFLPWCLDQDEQLLHGTPWHMYIYIYIYTYIYI